MGRTVLSRAWNPTTHGDPAWRTQDSALPSGISIYFVDSSPCRGLFCPFGRGLDSSLVQLSIGAEAVSAK
eukprot:15436395-Alexandrium_andersonii.AAC.1